MLASLLVFVHLLADLVWIGSSLAVAVVLGADAADSRQRGALARRVHQRLAQPAFGVALLTGAGRLALAPDYYLVQTHFMHAKLVAALGVIGLHHALGARARKLESGALSTAGSAMGLGAGLLACAAVAVYLALQKPF